MKPLQVIINWSNIQSKILIAVAVLFLAGWPGKSNLLAQSLIVDASVQQEAGSLIQVRGDLILRHRPVLDGTMALEGSLLDMTGLQVALGTWLFNGTGQDQFVEGTETILLHHVNIAADARVVLRPTTRVTVAGSLVNHNEEAGLLLESTEDERASLLHHQAGVNASVLYTLPEQALVQRSISSPVAQQDIEPEFHQEHDSFGSWYEKTQAYVLFTHQNVYPTFRDANEDVLYFLPAKGYTLRHRPRGDKSLVREFHGALHQGLQEFTLMVQSHPLDPFTGFNLMGNPYPSAIDWLAEEGWSGREYLVGGKNGDFVMWLWNDSIQNYGAFHPRSRTRTHNGNRGLIQPMDAFWVQAELGNDGKKIGMDDRVRLHGKEETGNQYDKACGQTMRIILASDEGPQRDEVIVELGHQRPGVARKKLPISGEAPQLYAISINPSCGLVSMEEPQGQRQPAGQAYDREAGGYSILLLEQLWEEVRIPLLAITRDAGKYFIRLEHGGGSDAEVFLTKGSHDSATNEADDNTITRVGKTYRLNATEETMHWELDLIIRP